MLTLFRFQRGGGIGGIRRAGSCRIAPRRPFQLHKIPFQKIIRLVFAEKKFFQREFWIQTELLFVRKQRTRPFRSSCSSAKMHLSEICFLINGNFKFHKMLKFWKNNNHKNRKLHSKTRQKIKTIKIVSKSWPKIFRPWLTPCAATHPPCRSCGLQAPTFFIF